jgi:hypothetical protein
MRKDPAHLLKFTQGSDPAKKVSVDLVCGPWVLTIPQRFIPKLKDHLLSVEMVILGHRLYITTRYLLLS